MGLEILEGQITYLEMVIPDRLLHTTRCEMGLLSVSGGLTMNDGVQWFQMTDE